MNTQKLLVVIPYHTKDVELTRKLLLFIKRLSPTLAPHCCMLAADSVVPQATKIELGNIAKSIFHQAETAIIAVPGDLNGWPKAANAMFRIASRHVEECYKMPWLWMEPDCTPMRPSWLDEIAVHYDNCPKRFMGCFVRSEAPPLPPVHLAGCAVYPVNVNTSLAEFGGEGVDMAWDIAAASYTVPRAIDTPLIRNHYGTIELPPTFKEVKEPGDPINTCTLGFVPQTAALFHRCKDGTLIDLLAKRMDTATAEAPEPKAKRPKKTPVPA